MTNEDTQTDDHRQIQNPNTELVNPITSINENTSQEYHDNLQVTSRIGFPDNSTINTIGTQTETDLTDTNPSNNVTDDLPVCGNEDNTFISDLPFMNEDTIENNSINFCTADVLSSPILSIPKYISSVCINDNYTLEQPSVNTVSLQTKIEHLDRPNENIAQFTQKASHRRFLISILPARVSTIFSALTKHIIRKAIAHNTEDISRGSLVVKKDTLRAYFHDKSNISSARSILQRSFKFIRAIPETISAIISKAITFSSRDSDISVQSSNILPEATESSATNEIEENSQNNLNSSDQIQFGDKDDSPLEDVNAIHFSPTTSNLSIFGSVYNVVTRFLIDTGAAVSAISAQIFEQLPDTKLHFLVIN